ncbi:hypothetical protein FRC16_000810 [Serendipita sp. 398]|nr:hypothetical protein FRC16_000810 [Serendipita sp. 398]
MEATYKRQMQQTLSNPEVAKTKKELRKTRAACDELAAERDVLLDRISALENATRSHPNSSITSRQGSDRDARLKARLLPALKEPLNLDYDPLASSRHCGPEAKHSRNQRALQQQQPPLPPPDQTLPIKADPEREIIRMPKRSRASAGKSSGITTTVTAATSGIGTPSSSSNMGGYPIEISADTPHGLDEGHSSAATVEGQSIVGSSNPLVSRSGTKIRIKAPQSPTSALPINDA